MNQVPSNIKFASFSRRLAGFVLDLFVLNIVSGVFMQIFFGTEELQQWIQQSLDSVQSGGRPLPLFSPWLLPFCIAFPACYVSFFWVKLRATPAQYILKMKVLNHKTGQTLSWNKALVRFAVLYGTSLLLVASPLVGPIGAVFFYLSMRSQPQGRGLHDMAAGSVVVMQTTIAEQDSTPEQKAESSDHREF